MTTQTLPSSVYKKKFFPLWATLFIQFLINFSNPSAYAQTDLKTLLEGLGLQPVQSTAPDFSLPDLNKKTHTLSDYKNQWTVLVFWEPWCGVCVQELPHLEKAFQEFQNLGLRIVGITTHQGDISEIESFVKEHQLTFPILVDPSQEMARKYRIQAVPTLYLVSPQLQIVGRSMGGVHWEDPNTLAVMKRLLKLKDLPAPTKTSPTEASESDQVALPSDLEPPKILWKLPPSRKLTQEEWFPLHIEIRWPGPSHQYLIKTPRLPEMKEVELGSWTSFSEAQENESVLTYVIPLRFKKTGPFTLGPLTLAFSHRTERGAQEQSTQLPSENLQITPLEPTIPSFVVYGIVGFIFLILLIGGLVFFKHQKKSQQSPTALQEDKAPLYERIKQYKLDGHLSAYQIELLKLFFELSSSCSPELIDKYKALFEKVQYGGHQLSAEEIQLIEKQIEKIIYNKNENAGDSL